MLKVKVVTHKPIPLEAVQFDGTNGAEIAARWPNHSLRWYGPSIGLWTDADTRAPSGYWVVLFRDGSACVYTGKEMDAQFNEVPDDAP